LAGVDLMFLPFLYLAVAFWFELLLGLVAYASFSVLSTFSFLHIGYNQLLLYALFFFTVWFCERAFSEFFSFLALILSAILFDITFAPFCGLYAICIVAYFGFFRSFFYSIISTHVSEIFLIVGYVLSSYLACELCAWLLLSSQLLLLRLVSIYLVF
jgi:hypothetical protein